MASLYSEASSDIKPEFTSDDSPKLLRHHQGMGTPTKKSETKEVGWRLRQFRLGLAQARETYHLKTLRSFAEETGIDEDNLSNWERGVSLVPIDYIGHLKEHFGVNNLFEWIYGADARGLPGDLRDALKEAPPRQKKTAAADQRRKRA